MKLSSLQTARYQYSPKLPGMLRGGIAEICVKNGGATESVADQEKIKALFPNTYGKNEITFQKGQNTAPAKKQVVGVILSGGQAPGGHNVICGLYDALKATDKENVLIGFKGGPSGLLEDDNIIFTDEYINAYRNTGGFDIIGSGRTKLETEEQFAIVVENCKKHGVNALVIIGGDDSNTNAAVLAEYCAAHNTGIPTHRPSRHRSNQYHYFHSAPVLKRAHTHSQAIAGRKAMGAILHLSYGSHLIPNPDQTTRRTVQSHVLARTPRFPMCHPFALNFPNAWPLALPYGYHPRYTQYRYLRQTP